MRSASRLNKLAVAALVTAALAFAACTSTPPPVAAHNLERPSDIAFACVGLLPIKSDPMNPDDGTVVDLGTPSSTPRVSGLPMDQCNVPGQFDPPFNTERRTFAFVANSARGELSVLDLNNSKLIDLDLANPETNVAPLGVLPEQMSASSDGCRIVTANRGSCDLTLVDVSTLMSPQLALEGKVAVNSTGPSTVTQEIVVRGGTTGKPLRLNPQEIKFLPQDTSAIFQRSTILHKSIPATQGLTAANTANLCSRDGPHADPIGWNATPSQPVETQWKALVTYPTCNLVALVDLPSGNIVDSVKVNVGADGVSIALESTGSDPDCPVEDFCDGRTPPDEAAPDGGADSSTDAGSASDAGTPATAVSSDPFVNPTGVRPGSMAIVPDAKRAYVGLAQASFVAAIDILPDRRTPQSPSGTLAIPPTGGSIKLHESALGANVVRLSVDPFQGGADGQLGGFVPAGNNLQRQYLYVVARDGTVRVVNISPRTQLLPETECDVNVDPRFVPIQSNDPLVPDRTNICWPTEPPDFAHRRPLARGPGITLPSLARDVAFADLTTNDQREVVLDGTYAFVLTASGSVYEVNIAPTLRTQQEVGAVLMPSPLQEVQPLINSLRDANMVTFNASLDPSVGPARVDLAPTVPALGPQIAAINTSSPDDNATIVTNTSLPTYIFFPQQVCTRSTPNPFIHCDSALPMIQPQRQTWNILWEGDVFGPSFTGQLAFKDRTTGLLVDHNDPKNLCDEKNPDCELDLTDSGNDFCQAGALPGDFVTLFGCTVDSQCGPQEVCRRSSTAPDTADALPINGLCVPNDSASAKQTQRLNDCAPLLNSLRRYEITDAKSVPNTPSKLTLAPKIDEIASGTLTTCLTAKPPKAGASAADDVKPVSCNPPDYTAQNPYQCLDLDGSNHLRCVEICAQDSDCRSGRSCVEDTNAPLFATGQKGPLKFCAQGVPLTATLIGKCQLDQLASYKIGAGESFVVQGTAATPFVSGLVDPTTFSCVPNPERMDRIPYFQTVNGTRTPIPDCTNDAAKTPLDTALSPADLQAALLAIVHETPTPNPCLIRSSTQPPTPAPTQQDPMPQKPPLVIGPPFRVAFQNREIRFLLTGFEQFGGNLDQITFDVHGGFQPDQVAIPSTIDINLPNRIVTGPVDSQGQAADLGPTHELPFIFVIDQRRLGSIAAGVGATRGQVLRINPRRATTTDTNSLVPIYDDPVSTGNLWPVQ